MVCAFIKFTSKGHIIFQKRRIGTNDKGFTLKFRTMKCGTTNVATELLKDAICYITCRYDT